MVVATFFLSYNKNVSPKEIVSLIATISGSCWMFERGTKNNSEVINSKVWQPCTCGTFDPHSYQADMRANNNLLHGLKFTHNTS